MSRPMTMGVLVGNRGFFPSHLATSGRLEIIAALEAAGIKPIVLHPDVTAHGAVETYEDAKKCAALFKAHAAEIDGLIIFGEGIYEFSHPPSTVLAELHPAFWWGMLMVLFGGFYTFNFRPKKD